MPTSQAAAQDRILYILLNKINADITCNTFPDNNRLIYRKCLSWNFTQKSVKYILISRCVLQLVSKKIIEVMRTLGTSKQFKVWVFYSIIELRKNNKTTQFVVLQQIFQFSKFRATLFNRKVMLQHFWSM